MNVYISMLRGINVAGHKRISMEGLKGLYEVIGFERVRTYIQSGNVVFESGDSDETELSRTINRKIKQTFGLEVPVLIRTKGELERVIKHAPFAGKDEAKLHVTFLTEKPAEIPEQDIEKAKDKSEAFWVRGREIYLFCPNGYGRTKLSNSFFEKKLKMDTTTRNWNTVKTLLSMAKE